jgi:Ni/Fe-hydrogenase subunit HybB-like protein
MSAPHHDDAAAHIERDTLATLAAPGWRYWLLLLVMVGLVACGGVAWALILRRGLGLTGLNAPVMWGSLITSFVFFIGISHSGTLVSAILYFTRSPLRPAIGRSAEAMTVIAIMTAGLYPLIHMGRPWFAFWLLPYANQRGLWPNFHSPLVWDIFAVCCYCTISALFLYMGMLPDLSLLSPRMGRWRRLLYKVLSLGFAGTDGEWSLLEKAYPIFAGVAIPLAVSVHSVVSWDFAMTLMPGWHSAIFAPYFVAGAIFSGLAMAIVLLALLRRTERLERYIRADHFDVMAKLLLAMSMVMSFVYVTEFASAMLRGSAAERAIFVWRATGRYALIYWLVVICNCLVPLFALSSRVRRSLPWMVAISVAVLVGMWFERFMIAVSLAHTFDPFSWGAYVPTLTEVFLCLGGFGWFGMLFLLFIKIFPCLSVAETLEGVRVEAERPGLVPAPEQEAAHA